MGLFEQINNDTIAAMKNGDKAVLGVLRMLKSDLKYKQIELKHKLTEDECIAVLSSSAKKCRDAIGEYEKASRDDLVIKEKAELEIIKKYLPEQIPDEEIERIIKEAIAETNASTPAEIGLVMKKVMPMVKGKADGRRVNELVLNILRG